MKIRLKSNQGTLLSRIEFLKGKESVNVNNAVVLTGANSSGKTVLIDSIAVSAGLGGVYSSSKTQHMYSSLDLQETINERGGAYLSNDKTQISFNLVLRYRGEGAKAKPDSVDTMEDVLNIVTAQGSHGQTASHRLMRVLQEVEEYLKKEKGKLLLLLDEPEVAMGPDHLLFVASRIRRLCEMANRLNRFKIVVATQNPFILHACEQSEATRLDLGGWVQGVDPFPILLQGMNKGYLDLAEKITSSVCAFAEGRSESTKGKR